MADNIIAPITPSTPLLYSQPPSPLSKDGCVDVLAAASSIRSGPMPIHYKSAASVRRCQADKIHKKALRSLPYRKARKTSKYDEGKLAPVDSRLKFRKMVANCKSLIDRSIELGPGNHELKQNLRNRAETLSVKIVDVIYDDNEKFAENEKLLGRADAFRSHVIDAVTMNMLLSILSFYDRTCNKERFDSLEGAMLDYLRLYTLDEVCTDIKQAWFSSEEVNWDNDNVFSSKMDAHEHLRMDYLLLHTITRHRVLNLTPDTNAKCNDISAFVNNHRHM